MRKTAHGVTLWLTLIMGCGMLATALAFARALT